MKSEYTKEQLVLIRRIAQIQIDDLIELQRNPEILQERVKESRDKGFDEVTISDYYEDIMESWQIWEKIAEHPENFLVQRYFHNYSHIQFVMENSFTPTVAEYDAWEGLLKKVVIAKNLNVNQN